MNPGKMLHTFSDKGACHAKYDELTDKGKNYNGLSCREIPATPESEAAFEIWEDPDQEAIAASIAKNSVAADEREASILLKQVDASGGLAKVIQEAVAKGVEAGVKASKE